MATHFPGLAILRHIKTNFRCNNDSHFATSLCPGVGAVDPPTAWTSGCRGCLHSCEANGGVCEENKQVQCTCSTVYMVHPPPPHPGYHGGKRVPESADVLLLLRPGLLLVLPPSPRGAKLPEQPGHLLLL